MTDSNYVGFDKIQQMKGYEMIEHVPKSSFRDTSMIVLCPTRGQLVMDEVTKEVNRLPFIHRRIKEAWDGIIWPMNGKRWFQLITGAEVGKAYSEQIEGILNHPDLGKWKYIATVEDDVLIDPMSFMHLLESIELGPFDGASGLYFTKGPFPQPMAYGSPQEYSTTGVLDFRPRDVVQAMQQGYVMEVNGIACGISLYRMDLFRDLRKVLGPGDFFQTLNTMTPQGPVAMTQDLEMCAKAKRIGKRFCVDLRVKCGHLDFATGEVF